MTSLTIIESEETKGRLEQLCAERGLDTAAVLLLMEMTRAQRGKRRRRGLFEQFDQVLIKHHEIV